MVDNGVVVVRGQFKNKFFSNIWDAAKAGTLKGYKVVSMTENISYEAGQYLKTNGEEIKGQMNRIILRKEP
jgi:hypothetical protein